MDNMRVYKGSRWLKFDFHTHTPASRDFGKGDPEMQAVKPEDWLKSAMEAKLDCVVVADHNTGEWIDALKEKNQELRNQEIKPEWYRDLTIFPGVEITSDGGSSRLHILAIFDPQKTTSGITALLGSCEIDPENKDFDSMGSKKSFSDIADIVHKKSGIPIAAHADMEKGLLHDVNNLSQSIQMNLESISGIELTDSTFFDGMHDDLAKAVKRMPIVQGSDAHTMNAIGTRYTWIKMGTPTLEALKLALMDFEYSVLNQEEDPNIHPNLFITKLSIKDMHVCGRRSPFVVDFNPHFNTFIGGRGSGKSTVLESIRIAARQDKSLEEDAPETFESFNKFRSLATDKHRGMMRNGTKISLEIMRRSQQYKLNWHFDGSEPVLEEYIDGIWETDENHGNLAERFGLLVYSQKQIHELAKDPAGLLGIIDRSSDVNKSQWSSDFDVVKNTYLGLKTQQRALVSRLSEESELRARLKDIENDLKVFEEGGHRVILLNYQNRRQQKNALPPSTVFDQFIEDLQGVSESIGFSDFPGHLFDPEDDATQEMLGIYNQTSAELAEIVRTLETAKDAIQAVKTQWKARIDSSEWYKSVVESEESYQQLVSEYETKDSKFSLALYDEWIHAKDDLLGRLKNLERNKMEILQLEEAIKQTEDRMVAMHGELYERRNQFIQKVIGDNPYVRMELVPFGDASKIENQYRMIFGLEQSLFSGAVYQSNNPGSLLSKFIDWENNSEPIGHLPEIISRIKKKTRSIAEGEVSGYHSSFDKRLKNLYNNNPSVFDEFDAWWPDDMLKVQYQQSDKRSHFEALEKGSDGQRAAAILAFLLSYGEEPLIIDQPEDDLDNALIYDLIVKQIHKNKKRRQLIIATHNPNIVVNGDSELVHVMKFDHGQIRMAHQGDLGDPKIREHVCVIMEGGREAFDKRYKRVTLGDKDV